MSSAWTGRPSAATEGRPAQYSGGSAFHNSVACTNPKRSCHVHGLMTRRSMRSSCSSGWSTSRHPSHALLTLSPPSTTKTAQESGAPESMIPPFDTNHIAAGAWKARVMLALLVVLAGASGCGSGQSQPAATATQRVDTTTTRSPRERDELSVRHLVTAYYRAFAAR